MHHPAKFRQNQLNRGRDMAIFRFSRWQPLQYGITVLHATRHWPAGVRILPLPLRGSNVTFMTVALQLLIEFSRSQFYLT